MPPSRGPHLGALAAVTDLVPFLTWRVGPPAPHDLVGAELAADPAGLARHVAATAAGRGSTDPKVLASLWWHSYAYRVAGTVLAAWVVAGSAPDASSAGTAVAVSGDRPSSLVVDPLDRGLTALDDVVGALFAGHLDGVAAALRARHPVGWRLLWGDVAGAVASALGAVGSAPGAPPLRDRVEAATAALPHGVAAGGVRPAGSWSYRRTTCCLWWKTDEAGGALCDDCSLL